MHDELIENEVTILWDGKSGKEYEFWIYEIGYPMASVPCNYCFAKETEPHKWSPIYFGETGDISERFDYHQKIDRILQHGATHIHAHISGEDREVRRVEEADLVAKWKPPCND